MNVTGLAKYAACVDQQALAAFLRTHGASEEKIEATSVRFIAKLKHPFSFFLGEPRGYARGTHITLATEWVERADDPEKAFDELNAILLHEAVHVVDRGTRHEVYALIFLAVFLICYMGVQELAYTALAHVHQTLLIIGTIIVTFGPIIPGVWIFYRLNPSELRARKMMKEDVRVVRRQNDPAL